MSEGGESEQDLKIIEPLIPGRIPKKEEPKTPSPLDDLELVVGPMGSDGRPLKKPEIRTKQPPTIDSYREHAKKLIDKGKFQGLTISEVVEHLLTTEAPSNPFKPHPEQTERGSDQIQPSPEEPQK